MDRHASATLNLANVTRHVTINHQNHIHPVVTVPYSHRHAHLSSRYETRIGGWVRTVSEFIRVGVVREVLLHPVHALAIQHLYTCRRKATDCCAC